MKRILSIAIITLLVHLGFAQDFGIGIVPTEKLHVAGNTLVTGNVYIGSSDSYFYRDQANRIATPDRFYVQSASANTYLYSTNTYLGGSSGDLIMLRGNTLDWDDGILNSSGNLGLGTTSPSQKLDVNGSLRIRGGSPQVGYVLVATGTDGTADWAPQPGDNLGNHSATQNLDMNSNDITEVNLISTINESDYDKLRVWSSSSYTIGMHSGMTMGGLGDWAMTFTMNNDAEGDRGFLWRDVDDAQDDGAMALTITGHLTVKERVDIGTSASSGSDLYLGDDLRDWDNTGYIIDPNSGNRVNEIEADDGSAGDASYMFAGDGNTGFYQPADNQIGITSDGTAGILIDENRTLWIANDLRVRDNNDAINGDDIVYIFDSNNDGICDIYENNGMMNRLRGDGQSLFNEQSQNNIDVRMESEANENMFFLDAGTNEVGIGTNAPNARFTVNGTASKTGGGLWASYSDRRVKRDIVPYRDGLADVLKIDPVKYKFKKEFAIPDDKDREFVGVIAQDMQEIAPYMVETYMHGEELGHSEDGQRSFVTKEGQEMLMYDPSALRYMLVNAVKEQQRIIEGNKMEREELMAEWKTLRAVLDNMD